MHFHQRLERPVKGAEDLIGWGVWIFAEQKASGTFAFLFGVGFAVLLRRLESRGTPIVPVYLRRLAALAVFGIVATVGLGFSILFEYACWGLVLLLVRRWPTRRLLVLALVAACARPIVAEASALYAWWTHAAASPAGPNLWAMGTTPRNSSTIPRCSRRAGRGSWRTSAPLARPAARVEPHTVHPRTARRCATACSRSRSATVGSSSDG